MTKDPKKVAMGKKSKAAGGRFELKVRKDLEKKGWIVSKWMNNLEIMKYDNEEGDFSGEIKMIPAKHKFRGPGIPMAIGTGFPDFIAFRFIFRTMNVGPPGEEGEVLMDEHYQIIGVESKMTGILKKVEKEKMNWLLQNNIFSKILIAQKSEKRGEIIYIEFTKEGEK